MACKFCITNAIDFIDNDGGTDELDSVWVHYRGESFIAENSRDGEAYIGRMLSSNTGIVNVFMSVDDAVINIDYCPFCGAYLWPENITKTDSEEE